MICVRRTPFGINSSILEEFTASHYWYLEVLNSIKGKKSDNICTFFGRSVRLNSPVRLNSSPWLLIYALVLCLGVWCLGLLCFYWIREIKFIERRRIASIMEVAEPVENAFVVVVVRKMRNLKKKYVVWLFHRCMPLCSAHILLMI